MYLAYRAATNGFPSAFSPSARQGRGVPEARLEQVPRPAASRVSMRYRLCVIMGTPSQLCRGQAASAASESP